VAALISQREALNLVFINHTKISCFILSRNLRYNSQVPLERKNMALYKGSHWSRNTVISKDFLRTISCVCSLPSILNSYSMCIGEYLRKIHQTGGIVAIWPPAKLPISGISGSNPVKSMNSCVRLPTRLVFTLFIPIVGF
jgi:hypothetical protein